MKTSTKPSQSVYTAFAAKLKKNVDLSGEQTLIKD